MRRTSEIQFTDITKFFQQRMPTNVEYYKDSHTILVEPGFTEYLNCTATRYSPVFWFYKNDTIIGNSLRHYGEYTEIELGLLRNFQSPHCVIYDIGANIGVHTIAFAKNARKVYAFEPNEKNYKLLKVNVGTESNVECFNLALGDKDGVISVTELKLDEAGNYGECMITDVGQIAEMTTVDKLYTSRKLLAPTIIKIDVEGVEWEVIQGMKTTIEENLPIIFYEAHQCDTKSIYDYLNKLGYSMYWFPVPNYNPNNFRKNEQNIFGNGGVVNILAIPFHIQGVKVNMPKVIDNADTWAKCFERLTQKQDAKRD